MEKSFDVLFHLPSTLARIVSRNLQARNLIILQQPKENHSHYFYLGGTENSQLKKLRSTPNSNDLHLFKYMIFFSSKLSINNSSYGGAVTLLEWGMAIGKILRCY